MKETMEINRHWIVVLVERGIATEVTVFSRLAQALEHKKRVAETLRPHEDDIGVFEATGWGSAEQVAWYASP